jgi:hypothetical protein
LPARLGRAEPDTAVKVGKSIGPAIIAVSSFRSCSF